jgi:hypothetical protein
MLVTLDVDRSVCVTDYDNDWNNMVWIPIANLILSSLSLICIIKYFHEMTKVFDHMRLEYQISLKALEQQRKLTAVLKHN